MKPPILVREWNAESFHARVIALEAAGYMPRRETYRITADMDPATGVIIHLHSMEMLPPEPTGG